MSLFSTSRMIFFNDHFHALVFFGGFLLDFFSSHVLCESDLLVQGVDFWQYLK